jgi:Fe-S-cluster-containing dehydrogenase component
MAGPGLARAGTDAGEEPLATLIDISRCIGCEECVYACQDANAHKFPEPEKPFPKMVPDRVPVEDWSDRRDVTDRLTPYNWLYI